MNDRPVTVLLIEGSADDAAVARRHLREDGSERGPGERFEVKEASRLTAACQLLAAEEFDAVLLGLDVPRCEGIEGFRRLRRQHPGLPLLVLTGPRDEELAREAVREGAQGYLVKGTLDFCLLKSAVRHAIGLKRLSAQLERMVEGDPRPRLVVDAEGVVRLVNAAAAAVLGSRARELVGRPCPKSLAGAASSPVDWAGGEARLVCVPAGDASSDGVSPESRLFHRVSHEMRNALSTVKTALHCLREPEAGPQSERQRQLLDMISRNVDRQARLMDNVLDLGRLRSGRLRLERRPLDLAPLLAELEREARLRRDGPAFSLEAPASLPPVEGDADLLLQALRNLVDNALRFAKSRVAVRAAADGTREIRLEVEDDGPGVPEDRRDELFGHFAQLGRAAGRAHKGAGLGLAICREIVEGHGGSVRLDDSYGAGARFRVRLPRLDRVTPRSTGPDARSMAPTGAGAL